MNSFYFIAVILTALGVYIAYKLSPQVGSFLMLVGFNGLLSVGILGIIYNKFYSLNQA